MKQPFWIFGILRSRFRDVHYFLAQNVFSDYLEETFFVANFEISALLFQAFLL
jgi:hypothetical protein